MREGKKGPHVLLIEDDPIFQSIMERVGALAGISVQSFSSVDGLAISKLLEFDVVICDFETAGLTGLQTSVLLRRYVSEVPVLLISAYHRIRGVDETAFVHKSVGPQIILSKALSLKGPK